MEYIEFKIDFKASEAGLENGEFEGMASVFGNVDQGNDIVDKGAFTRTLEHKGNEIPLLWHHNPAEPIGVGIVHQNSKGLAIKGKLNLEVQKAREAHSLLRQKAVKGLSIGFQTVKEKFDGAIRHLKELKLFEVSVVTFPMNAQANINGVKNELTKPDTSFKAELLQLIGRCDVLKAKPVISDEEETFMRKVIGGLNGLLGLLARENSADSYFSSEQKFDGLASDGQEESDNTESDSLILDQLKSYTESLKNV